MNRTLFSLLCLWALALSACNYGLRIVNPRARTEPRWRVIQEGSSSGGVATQVEVQVSSSKSYAVLPAEAEKAGQALPGLLDDYILSAVQQVTTGRVIGWTDLDAIIGFEQKKALIGCDDQTCLAELGGALGVDHLVSVRVAQVEDQWVLTGKVVDIRRAVVKARHNQFVSGAAASLLRAVPGFISTLVAASEQQAGT